MMLSSQFRSPLRENDVVSRRSAESLPGEWSQSTIEVFRRPRFPEHFSDDSCERSGGRVNSVMGDTDLTEAANGTAAVGESFGLIARSLFNGLGGNEMQL